VRVLYYFLFFLLLQASLYGGVSIEKSYFIDVENTYTSENIYEHREQFSTLTKNNNAFGFRSHTVWIYLKLTNEGKESIANVVEFPYPLLDYLEVLEYEEGVLTQSYTTGDLTNFNTRKEESNTFVIPYTLEAHSSKELMIGVSSKGPLNLKINFMSKKEYVTSAKENAMILGIYYGAIIIMLIYNLILFFMIKERVYLYYVLFHFFYLFAQLALNGLGFEYIWPNTPEINAYFFLSMMIIINYLAILFSISFLDIKKYHPKFFKFFKVFMLVFVTLFPLNFILPYEIMAKVVTVISAIALTSLFVSGVYVLIKDKTASSKFYVIAWSFFLLGVLVTQVSFMGFLPVNFLTLYGNQIGAFIELALLSIALAYRYNTLFVKLTQKEAELRVFNEELEVTIEERTQTIKNKNIQLAKEIKNKNILHKELFHRVKNNLQMISGILHMHSKKLEDKMAQDVLKHSIQTISSMGMIHEKLYKSDNLESIDFHRYFLELVSYIKQSLPSKKIEFEVECEDSMITLQNSVPLGLIVNEIITNSIKHAFNETGQTSSEDMKITIKMRKDAENNVELHISDNGVGIEIPQLKKNFGFKLIESLVTYQLKGDIEFYSINGFAYVIKFEDSIIS